MSWCRSLWVHFTWSFFFFSSFFGKYHLHILLCFSPKCQHPLESSFYISGYLVSVAAAKGHFLIIWLWRLKGLRFRSNAAVTIRERLLDRLPPPEHCMDSRLKQLSPPPRPPAVFLRDRSICLSRRFGLKVRLLVWHISRGLWNFSQGAIFEFPLCLAIAHQ